MEFMMDEPKNENIQATIKPGLAKLWQAVKVFLMLLAGLLLVSGIFFNGVIVDAFKP
jgi:hypothetical protein